MSSTIGRRYAKALLDLAEEAKQTERVGKDLADFAKRAPALTLKGAYFEGRVLSAEQTKSLATLESREVMLAKIASMSITPIQQAVNVFAAGLNKLGAALAQCRCLAGDRQGRRRHRQP